MDRSVGIFTGVRFVLFGFDSVSERQCRLELNQKGAVDLGKYDQRCTHVIVSGLIYDDPVCVLARSEGKIVVNETWINDSLDLGILADPTREIYKPVKDLNGISGAQFLHICLTGYQRQKREDLMTMVNLMGARYSKALNAKQVTHLICYKFEGQKYELAKTVNVKLVNHRWIEDSLKAWEIQPIDNYTKSGYELDIMDAHTINLEEKTNADVVPTKHDGPFNAFNARTACHTVSVISNISAASSVSSNATTISKLRKKCTSPVESSSSHCINFTPKLKVNKRKTRDESESCEDFFSQRDKDSAQIQEANVGRPNILESMYSKLFTFLKKIKCPS